MNCFTSERMLNAHGIHRNTSCPNVEPGSSGWWLITRHVDCDSALIIYRCRHHHPTKQEAYHHENNEGRERFITILTDMGLAPSLCPFSSSHPANALSSFHLTTSRFSYQCQVLFPLSSFHRVIIRWTNTDTNLFLTIEVSSINFTISLSETLLNLTTTTFFNKTLL